MATYNKTEAAKAIMSALASWNTSHGTVWQEGIPFDATGGQFETWVYNELYTKLTEFKVFDKMLGNRFAWLYQEDPGVGQLSEEVIFKDIIPVNMNKDKDRSLVFRHNYARIFTMIYAEGIRRKNKVTFDDNEMRKKFRTLGEAATFVVKSYSNIISGFNQTEESEVKAMMVDYAVNVLSDTPAKKREVHSYNELIDEVFVAIQNIQNNSWKYNEYVRMSGGGKGRSSTVTRLEDVMILTDDITKVYLLNTKIANTFNEAGLDIMKHIISFDTLGDVWKLTDDVTTTAPLVEELRDYGDYQIDVGDVLKKGTILTVDVTDIIDDIEEIKPDGNLFAFVVDTGMLGLKHYTKDMVKRDPYKNQEFEEITHYFMYTVNKYMRVQFNSVLVHGTRAV